MSTSTNTIQLASKCDETKLIPEPHQNTGRFDGNNRPAKRYYDEAVCEGPGCSNIIPAGYYQPQRVRSFCSGTCRNREAACRYVVGTCLHCCGPVMGHKNEDDKQFCSKEHMRAHLTEQIMGPTGTFRPLIEDYMATGAANYYALGTLNTVRVSLSRFFRFVAQVEQITQLDDIRPTIITRFIATEVERGLTSRNSVGHLATLFNWLIAEERYDRANPVVSRIHSQKNAPAAARPYNDRELQAIWDHVERSGKLELMLAFAIGEECGLRVGEVSNIRLSDIDVSSQTIFVRLPTKNKRTRTVPFHSKVKKYLELWRAKRDPNCPHDHLLHNTVSSRFTRDQLDTWFSKLLSKESEPAGSFKFHRLRHTWATRLMNNGMELAVLKELGGWEKWNSMQCYIKVLETTVRSQYQASYTRLQERQESGEDEVISLVDFAMMDSNSVISLPASIT